MRVALIGPYPRDAIDELTSNNGKIRHPGNWINNLPFALKRYTNLEIHIITDSDRIGHDLTVQREGIWFHIVSVPPKIAIMTGFRIHIHRLAKTLGELAPDIIHTQGTDYYAIAAKQANVAPIICTIHGIRALEARLYTKGLKSSIHWMFLKHFEKQTLNSIKYAVMISPYVLETFDLNETVQYKVIENCTDKVFFGGSLSYSPVEGIVFVGALDQRKRFVDVIRTALLLHQRGLKIPIHVVSSTPLSQSGYVGDIQSFIKINNFNEFIHWHGRQDPSGIRKILMSGSVLILPSLQETTPTVIIEAMACGRPVVATRVGGIPYMLKEGETGFMVEVGDVNAMANRIQELIEDPNFSERMGRKAHQQAMQRFHPKIAAYSHEGFYKEICGCC